MNICKNCLHKDSEHKDSTEECQVIIRSAFPYPLVLQPFDKKMQCECERFQRK